MNNLKNILAKLECRQLLTGPSSELSDFLDFCGFSKERAAAIHMCLQEPQCTITRSSGSHQGYSSFSNQWKAWLARHRNDHMAQSRAETHINGLVPNIVVHESWRTMLSYPSDARPWFEMFKHKIAQLALLFPAEPELVFREACHQTVQPVLAHITDLAEQGVCVMDYDMRNLMSLWYRKDVASEEYTHIVHIRWALESFTALNLDLESVEVNGTWYCLPERLTMIPSIYASHMFLQFSTAFLKEAPGVFEKTFGGVWDCRLRHIFEHFVQASIPHFHLRMPGSLELEGWTGLTDHTSENKRMGLQRYVEILRENKSLDVGICEKGFIPWFPKHLHIAESPEIRRKLLRTWSRTRLQYDYVPEIVPNPKGTFIPDCLFYDGVSTSMSTWPVVDEMPLTVDLHGRERLRPEVRLLLHSCDGRIIDNNNVIKGVRVKFCLNVLVCEDTLQPKFRLPFFSPPCVFSVSGSPLLASQMVKDKRLTREEVEKEVGALGCSRDDVVLCNMDRRHGLGFDEEEDEEEDVVMRPLAQSASPVFQSCGLFANPKQVLKQGLH